jgi:hypothetical protein
MSDVTNQLIGLLRANGERWQALATGIDPALLRRRPEPGEWSALECIGHAMDTEAGVFAKRVRAFLADADVLEAYEPDVEGTPITDDTDPADLARRHARERADTLALLATVSEPDLARAARHLELGTVTLGEMLDEFAGHDLMHLVQAERALMQAFIPGSGPWRPYFRAYDVEADGAAVRSA